MRGRKTAVWTNDLGTTVRFDNRFIFLESIDMTGNGASFTTYGLAGADGQQTVDVSMSTKVIPCTLAFYDRDDDGYMRRFLTGAFNPKVKGTLTVYTAQNRYQIECRPQALPTFKREAVGCVWRFDVDFVADFPYWKAGAERSVTLDENAVTVTSFCPFDIPPRIYFPANSSDLTFQVQYRLRHSDRWSTAVNAFKVKGSLGGTERDFPLWINVQTLKITDSNGNNVSHWVDASAQTDRAMIRYGENQFVCHGTFSGTERPVLYYHELSQGEL